MWWLWKKKEEKKVEPEKVVDDVGKLEVYLDKVVVKKFKNPDDLAFVLFALLDGSYSNQIFDAVYASIKDETPENVALYISKFKLAYAQLLLTNVITNPAKSTQAPKPLVRPLEGFNYDTKKH